MATSYDVNLKIGSAMGFNVVGRGLITGSSPVQTTTLTLDGDVFSPSGYNTSTRNLSIAPLSDFVLSPGTTSTRQLVHMTNNGNSALTVTEILYSLTEGISPRFYFYSTASILNSSTITILPQNTATFQLAYLASEEGEYNSYFIVVSNNDSGYYKVNTRQLCQNTYDFAVTPAGFDTNINTIGNIQTQTYYIIPIFNGVETPNTAVPVSGTITGSSPWTIVGTGTNSITVQFDAAQVNNINGPFTSVLTIASGDITHEVTNTATVFIDHDINKNLASWLSPVSYDNSVIGVSYDLENDQRILTIGVGTSSGALSLTSGDPHIYTSDLGLGKQYSGYANWSKVYRIPFVGDARTYYSNDYVYKTTTTSDYSSYFGEFDSAGSMFVVTDDGYGTALVELNNLTIFNTSTVTTSTVYTLHNLTRAFHYYSDIDIGGGRITVRYHSDWFNAISTADTKFLFIQNNNDTLIKNSMVLPFVDSLPPSKTNLELVTEGTVTPGVYDHNYTTSLSDHIKDYAVKAFPATPTTSTTVSTAYDIPYGENRLQKVDVLVPLDVTPRGVIMHIHGGGWNGGSKSASGFSPSDAAYTNNDDAEIQLVAQAGYYVINCNYRLTSLEAYGYGGDGTGGYPNAIDDIKTILRYCLISGAGTLTDSRWDLIHSGISTYGLLVTGSSVGGHLAMMGVCDFGTETGLWPLAVGSTAGPMDLVYSPHGKNDNPLDSPVQDVVNSFIYPDGAGGTLGGYNDDNAKASSPRYKYGNFLYSDQFIPSFPEYTSALANDPTTTQLFTGFDYNTRDRTATTATSIVSIPS